jgi:glycosyltransferase involved in cell wall biosynthesis
LKILIISAADIQGGAARAAYRLHQSLLNQGVDSQMLVQSKSSCDWTVIGPINKIKKGVGVLRPTLDSTLNYFYKNKIKTLFSSSWLGFSDIVRRINKINPDIVHLHWICGGMMTVEDIARIKPPIVWSLHDMWAFTAGYHYDKEVRNHLKDGNILEKWVFKRKKRTYSRVNNITIVGLSRWLNKLSLDSVLLHDKKHVNLPNPINTDSFKPIDKGLSRELWNLPKDKKLILFGAMNATGDPRKGFKELVMALGKIKDEEIELVVFGSFKPKISQDFGFKTHYLGYIYDDVSLSTLYCSADVMVVPSLQENLSNSIMESLSCSTPVVGFDIGGNSDMVEHKINGYLATPFDTNDLSNGIKWVLINNSKHGSLGKNARYKVLKEFDSNIVAKKYIRLYKDIIE